jgi:hypothetical protein
VGATEGEAERVQVFVHPWEDGNACAKARDNARADNGNPLYFFVCKPGAYFVEARLAVDGQSYASPTMEANVAARVRTSVALQVVLPDRLDHANACDTSLQAFSYAATATGGEALQIHWVITSVGELRIALECGDDSACLAARQGTFDVGWHSDPGTGEFLHAKETVRAGALNVQTWTPPRVFADTDVTVYMGAYYQPRNGDGCDSLERAATIRIVQSGAVEVVMPRDAREVHSEPIAPREVVEAHLEARHVEEVAHAASEPPAEVGEPAEPVQAADEAVGTPVDEAEAREVE